MDFCHCSSPYCFNDQIDNSPMGLFLKGQWFLVALTEISGGASFASLITGIKIWWAATSYKCTHINERCCRFPESFLQLMQRGWLTLTGGELFTFYCIRPWWFDLYSTSSRSCRFNFEYWFTNIFYQDEMPLLLQISKLFIKRWMSILSVFVVAQNVPWKYHQP